MMLSHTFDETKVINHLKHFLPAQAPLKDFVHHNVLHFFQNTNFHAANELATKIFGYKTYLIINEYRALYESEEINDKTLDTIIIKHKGKENLNEFKFRLLYDNLHMSFSGRIGQVMHVWKDAYKVNLSKYIQPRLFRIISNYLDQGIALVEFPYKEASFLDNIRNIEQQSYFSYFIQKKGRARQWLLQNKNLNISDLLDVLVGQQEWYEDYLFDMCFEHPGWSGIVNIIEEQPESITKKRQITFKEFIILELLFQIDYLDDRFGQWKPLATTGIMPKNHLFDKIESDPPFELLKIWQEAYEWTYYQKILKALYSTNREIQAQDKSDRPKFQTVHCIDDREESFRRHLEYIAPQCETYSIAGFFNIDAYFQPQNSDYLLKISPTPTNPSHLILEQDSKLSYHIDRSLEVQKHSYFTGWLMAQPLGYWSAIKLISHFLKPHDNPATISAKNHIHADTSLKCDRKKDSEGDLLHVGFTIDEAVDRAEELLKSIGLINNFSKIIYIIGHGAGSTNNPYYAAYDCGACSGKPGSVNARVICYFLNKPEVRKKLL